MSLPRRVSVDDIQTLCNYFSKKPTGATSQEAKTVLDPRNLDQWKIPAMKYWGLLEEQEGRLKATSDCRAIAKNNGAERAPVLAQVIKRTAPYSAIIERASLRKENSLTATEVAAHWHDYFKEEASSNDDALLEQVTCFFQLAEGAELGAFLVGRKGAPTRFEPNLEHIAFLLEAEPRTETETSLAGTDLEQLEEETEFPKKDLQGRGKEEKGDKQLGQGIFIAHGKNKKPLEQLKKILDQFKIPSKVAIDEPNLGRPIGEKIREIMQSCNCAILIFTADEEFKDKDGNVIWRPSENVVYELGAAAYLYDNRIVIMKEENVAFPTNFRDIGYISFEKDQLEARAMDVLKELIGFGIVKVST